MARWVIVIDRLVEIRNDQAVDRPQVAEAADRVSDHLVSGALPDFGRHLRRGEQEHEIKPERQVLAGDRPEGGIAQTLLEIDEVRNERPRRTAALPPFSPFDIPVGKVW